MFQVQPHETVQTRQGESHNTSLKTCKQGADAKWIVALIYRRPPFNTLMAAPNFYSK